MPYITQQARDQLRNRDPDTAGELNFILTSVCLNYLDRKGERYQTYNDMIGALESCKLELYRRRIADYENLKIKENGDV